MVKSELFVCLFVVLWRNEIVTSTYCRIEKKSSEQDDLEQNPHRVLNYLKNKMALMSEWHGTCRQTDREAEKERPFRSHLLCSVLNRR